MYSFTKEQIVYDISGVSIGGQPGQYPTVVFGGLFFKGKPDFTEAERQVQRMLQLSASTGTPAIPDVFIKKAEYIPSILSFIERTLPPTHPFSVDIIEPALKVETLQGLADRHLLKRTIYNSLHIGVTPEEKTALRAHTPEMAIIVAFNPKDTSPDGKLEVLENGAHLTDTGLLQLASTLGIKKTLVDTAALAPGQNSGAALAALPVIKEEYGLPVGCAIHNVVEKSQWLRMVPEAKQTVDASSNSGIALFGGDFAIFGPIQNADLVIPLIAWHDILVSEYTEHYFGIAPVSSHPRRKLLK
ncbi:MAG: hypothetical protein JXA00_03505 [Candidatus Thermoplasmatota archaeon]|nr:hypothetical protein [Candidatus Thermoplasmatota archaeon]